MSVDIHLGTSIAYFRKLNGMTQSELAGLMNVSPQAVSKWEQHISCPDVQLLPRLSEIFNVSIDELFGKRIEKEIVYSLVGNVPWQDDGRLHVAFYCGRKLVRQNSYEVLKGENTLEISFHNVPYQIGGIFRFQCSKDGVMQDGDLHE